MDAEKVRERPILFSVPMVRAILKGRKTQTRRVVKPQPSESFTGPELYHPTKVDRHGEEYPGDPVFGIGAHDGEWGIKCPYGAPGDRLWVRETAYIAPPGFDSPSNGNVTDNAGRRRVVGYAALMNRDSVAAATSYGVKRSPSIHMPRWASRLTLEVAGVRVERLQDISEADAIAEGMEWREPTEADRKWARGRYDDGEFSSPDIDGVWIAPGTDNGFSPKGHREHWGPTAATAFPFAWDGINGKRAPWASNPWVWVIDFRRAPGDGT